MAEYEVVKDVADRVSVQLLLGLATTNDILKGMARMFAKLMVIFGVVETGMLLGERVWIVFVPAGASENGAIIV